MRPTIQLHDTQSRRRSADTPPVVAHVRACLRLFEHHGRTSCSRRRENRPRICRCSMTPERDGRIREARRFLGRVVERVSGIYSGSFPRRQLHQTARNDGYLLRRAREQDRSSRDNAPAEQRPKLTEIPNPGNDQLSGGRRWRAFVDGRRLHQIPSDVSERRQDPGQDDSQQGIHSGDDSKPDRQCRRGYATGRTTKSHKSLSLWLPAQDETNSASGSNSQHRTRKTPACGRPEAIRGPASTTRTSGSIPKEKSRRS